MDDGFFDLVTIEGVWGEACYGSGVECDRGEADGDWAISVF